MSSSAQSLGQLEAARSLALGESRYYPTIIPGVLPIIAYNGQGGSIDIWRWGADFLAETFASPAWPLDEKAKSALAALPILRDYLLEVQDSTVIKSAVQAAASIYPLVYRHIIAEPNDTQTWQVMLAIKTNILRRMDGAPPGVRICCVKFVQQVVLVQSPGPIADPRRPEQNDISLTLVPRDHRLIPYANQEAEASGLLDRLLDIVHGDHSDALLITATLNTLGMLIQRRPIVSNKILNSLFNFNPLKLANAPMTSKNKVLMKSIERTTRALLVNVMRRNPDGPFTRQIQQYLDRMHRMRIDVLDESNRKRPAPVEQTDGTDPAKRQRLGPQTVPTPPTPPIPALPAGPVSYRELFTLSTDANTALFDVKMFQDPEQLLRIVVPVLHSIDEAKLTNAINIIRSRYLTLSKAMPRAPPSGAAGATADDDEEYEPDFGPIEDAEQIINKLDSAPPVTTLPERIPDARLAPYKLPEAPPLTEQEVVRYGDMAVRRVVEILASVDEAPTKAKATKAGFNRLAASNYDRDSWVTVLCRLATRASAGLEDPDAGIKSEYGGEVQKGGSLVLSDSIRDAIYNYIIRDWKRRIDIAISWLTEEWYNGQILAQATSNGSMKNGVNGHTPSSLAVNGTYKKSVLRLLDGILAYIEGTDKVLVRFISEIPGLDRDILQRMKKMAEDPERIDLAVMVLKYLYMFRPPVRTICVDVLEDMWRTNDRAKPSAEKILKIWRPEVLREGEEGGDVKAA
ncbi:hypothetical protein P154DRAFT_525691 [Amniculicola lignicola CBS 123094]|uniref:Symplekin/Pta1 N-terminal domain-containing protein n=1 Tax=Amniculicola lignicola CBS 123094 TaxID=1392246 RepID=A0A6A5WF18_9PLEO|nr:hypothetical protein P154DRAFT_525691 [Amniculicola lignicola CBS 123094]